MEMQFVSLFFLNERNIGTSLKCTVVHYANLNSSSINKHYLRVAEYAISCFFIFLFMFILTRLLQKLYDKKLSFFNTNFQNSFQDVA